MKTKWNMTIDAFGRLLRSPRRNLVPIQPDLVNTASMVFDVQSSQEDATAWQAYLDLEPRYRNANRKLAE